MRENVFVKIKGLQMNMPAAEEELDNTVEIINVGGYSVVGEKEYIRYEEIIEGENEACSNLIKIAKDCVEITKRGAVTAHLSFVAEKKTMTCYETPYGNIYLGIFTRQLDILRREEQIEIHIDYSLELNYEHVSDCLVDIEITSKYNS